MQTQKCRKIKIKSYGKYMGGVTIEYRQEDWDDEEVDEDFAKQLRA